MKRITIFLLIGITYATVINIPIDYSTIQEGINASADGDTVIVAPGIYNESINFIGKNILVTSNYIFDEDSTFIESTVLRGESWISTVTFENGETSNAILSGFTIKDGFALFGAGISCTNNSSPSLLNLIIKDNEILTNPDLLAQGAGLFCENHSSPIVQNTIFDHNWCTVSGPWNEPTCFGGAICLTDSSNAVFVDVVIKNNSANYGGGGISIFNSAASLINTQIYNNSAPLGGGIHVDSSELLIVNSNIIENNFENYPWQLGGGLAGYGDNSIYFINTIMWDNYQSNMQFFEGSNDILIEYSDIELEIESIFISDSDVLVYSDNNLSSDPLFTDPENNEYNLQFNSPCIDSGDPDLDDDGITWENDPDDQDPDGTRMDIGVFYYHQPCPGYIIGDINWDAIVDILDIVILVECIIGPCPEPTVCMLLTMDINEDASVDILDVISMVSLIIES